MKYDKEEYPKLLKQEALKRIEILLQVVSMIMILLLLLDNSRKRKKRI
jgi:hypothetical protein